ncbi:MAG: type I methionyl aminopeptidase [Treponema sp.]|nr:type I methionyl aminopeptidase [Treponema sp.]
MIRLKNNKQIDGIRESCHMLSAMFRELIPLVKEGTETLDLDHWVHGWIIKAGGKPAFLGVGSPKNPFPGSICISVNDQVIHGIPSKRKIASGDLVSLDCGIDLGGYISDQAITLAIGRVSPEAAALVRVTEECLYKGIGAARTGDRLLQIGRAVQGHAHEGGFTVVHQFCGHGVGLALHEDPQVHNIPRGPNPKLSAGMVLAIEPMINMGVPEVKTLDDGWTVVTADGAYSAHWEHTVALFPDRTEILTEDVTKVP